MDNLNRFISLICIKTLFKAAVVASKKSHVSGSVSPMRVVRINVVFLHISGVGDSCDEEPKADTHKNSFPHGVGYLIPHFLIQKMDFLESSNIVFLHWSVCDCPYS